MDSTIGRTRPIRLAPSLRRSKRFRLRLLLERLEDRNLLAGDLECLRSRSIGDVALISHDVPAAPADIAHAESGRQDRAPGIAGDASSHSDTSNANGLDSEVATGAEPHSRPVVNWFEVLEPQGDRAADNHETWIVRIRSDSLAADSTVANIGSLITMGGSSSRDVLHVVRGLGRPGLVLLQSNRGDRSEVVETLQNNPHVEYFEQNFKIQAQETLPNDADFPRQTYLDNPTGYDIAAPSAWDTTTGNRELIVAVLDSGLDYSHPDLAGNVWINAGEIPASLPVVDVDGDEVLSFVDLNQPANEAFVDDRNGNGFIDADDLLSDPAWMDEIDGDGNQFVDDLFGWDFVADDPGPQDDNGHGTHVTGVIAAEGNNTIGVTGVSWQSSVMALKFLDENNSGDVKNAILAANYANMMRRDYGMDVRVINNSWVSLEGSSEALYQAFEESGVLDMLVVASAGNGNVFRQPNNNDEPGLAAYPASFDLENIISVTATDATGNLVPYFNYGQSSVDLAAPGLNIYSTEPGGGYGPRSGTSFAAPLVSAAALIVWANAPQATADEVRAAILEGVELDDSLAGKVSTGGRLNLRRALDRDTIAPRAELVSVSPIELRDLTDLDVSLTFSDESALDVSTIDLSDAEIRRVGLPTVALQPASVTVSASADAKRVDVTYTFTAPNGFWEEADNGDYQVFLRAGETADAAGNTARPLTLAPDDPLRLNSTPFSIAVPAPGTITVARFDDTLSSGSLRAAVIEANQAAGENTILLDEGVYELTIPGRLEGFARTGDLDIRDGTGSLTIIGKGADKTTIDAAGIDRVFDLKPGVTLTLKDVRLVGGDGVTWGGGIRNDGGTLTVLDSRFTNNHADFGGAIYNISGSLVIQRSEIDENRGAEGGGVYIYDGTAMLVGNLIAENSAERFGGGVNNFAGTLEIRDSTILQNNAGASGSGSGGGIETYGALTLINSDVSGNTVLVDGVVTEQEPNNSIAEAQNIDDSKWNKAPDPDIGSTAESIPHVTIQGTGDGSFDYFKFTVAAGDRGIFDIDYGAGGAGHIDTELFLFDASGDLIAENDDSSTTSGGAGSTANVDAYIDHTFDSAGTYIIAVGRYDSAAASGVVTGDAPEIGQTYTLQVSLSDKYSFALGGGIYVAATLGDETTVRIENSRIVENSANAGGGIFNDEGGKLTVVDSTVASNAAVTIEQVGLLDTDEYTAGGGIFTWDDMTILRTLISSNSAGVGGGIDISPVSGITVTVIESTIAENVAKSDEYAGGGGIRNGNAGEGGGTLIIRDSTIRDNLSTFEGGGLVNSGVLQMTGTTVSGNLAGNAGGIGNWGVANIDNSTISGNRASSEFDPVEIPSLFLFYRTGDGGGIYNSSIVVFPLIDFGSSAEMTITNSTVTDNQSDIDGAGIYVAGPDTYASNSIFQNNINGAGDQEDVYAGSHLTDLFGNGLGGRFISNGFNIIGSGFFRTDEGEVRLTADDRIGVSAGWGRSPTTAVQRLPICRNPAAQRLTGDRPGC